MTVAFTVSVTVMVSSGDPDKVRGGSGMLWVAGSALLVFLLMTVLSALCHRAPQRDVPARHALGVVGLPVLAIAGGAVVGVLQGTGLADDIVSAVSAAVGSVAGWLAVTRLRAQRQHVGY